MCEGSTEASVAQKGRMSQLTARRRGRGMLLIFHGKDRKNWVNGTFQINGTEETAEAGKCF